MFFKNTQVVKMIMFAMPKKNYFRAIILFLDC